MVWVFCNRIVRILESFSFHCKIVMAYEILIFIFFLSDAQLQMSRINHGVKDILY